MWTGGPILLIEDEPSVIAFLRAALERRGYSVVDAGSGSEGLKRLADGRYAGVISDIRMPGNVNGAEVHEWIQKNRPELRTRMILISGDTANSETQTLLAPERNSLHRETLSRAATDFSGGENIRETMSDDLKTRLLVVDDEQSIRRLCMTIGTALGFAVPKRRARKRRCRDWKQDTPDLVLTDFKLPTQTGVELLRQTKAILPRTEVAIMTGHGSIESAVDAMKLGAYDYIEKPFRVEKMRMLLQRMAEKVRLVTENQFLRERVDTEENLDGIIGTSANIQDVLRMISRLKDTRTPVLIAGESGTGKELVARAIHFRGAMAQTPFVAVDCGSLVPTLMESELFGYEKGAFTGRHEDQGWIFPSSQWRHDFPGRNRRTAAGDAGQAAARFAGKAKSGRWAAIEKSM